MLDFLLVCDIVLSETAALADVVLPVTQWAEERGTMTNLEGRVLLREQALLPPDNVRSDLDVLAALAERLDAPSAWPTDPQDVFAELCQASQGGPADYAGMSYARIAAGDGLFWPCPTADHPGTPRMFTDRFATCDGRARFIAVRHRAQAEPVDEHYPLHLTTGRILQHYQSGAQTRRVPALRDAAPEPFVEMHPDVADQLGLTDGEMVDVVSRRGRATAAARVTDDVRADTVFMPFHWGELGSANRVTNPALDPISKMPEFKVCAVRIESAGAAAENAA
jgi:assimilatory nitrate reductase catalytic subunit